MSRRRDDETTKGADDREDSADATIGSDGGGGWSGGFGDGEAPEHDTSIVEDSPEEDDDLEAAGGQLER